MFLHIAFKDLKTIFRDKKALALLILMPLLIILILGSALSKTFTEESSIKKFKVCVVNNDNGFFSKIFIDNVLKENMSKVFDTVVLDEKNALLILDNGEVPSIIKIPQNFTKNIEKNELVEIEILTKSNFGIKSNIIKSVVEGFAKNVSSSYSGAFSILDIIDKHNISFLIPIEGIEKSTVIMNELQKKLRSNFLEFKEKNQEKRKTVSAMQYYSAAMLIMFLLFGANTGSKLIVEEREGKTLNRIISTRANKITLIFGKFLGLFIICFAQSIVLILFTHFVYGVNWGNSPVFVIIITICSAFAVASFGMFIAVIAKTAKAAEGIGSVLIQVFTLLGGGMIPTYIMPDLMKKISYITINYWSTKGFTELMIGTSAGSIYWYLLVLIGMGILYLGIGINRFKI